jgi:acyl dehydratase
MARIVRREDIASCIGWEAEPTDWFRVEQSQIDAFADATLDHQFIHVDPVRAAATPFGGTIAHGFLTLSMLSWFAGHFSLLVEGAVMGLNYGFDKVRFLSPVRSGSEIRARAKVLDIQQKQPGQVLVKYEVTIEIRGEAKPAVVAEWLGMLVLAP